MHVYTHEVTERAVDSADGGVTKGIPELLLNFLCDAGTCEVLLASVELRETKLRTSPGDIDLVLRHVAGRGVVLSVGNPPCVVRHAQATDGRTSGRIAMNAAEASVRVRRGERR